MKRKEIRDRGVDLARRVAPNFVESATRRRAESSGGSLSTRVADLESRVTELEAEVQENRLLNMRLAELTDVVQELLVPLAKGDTGRLDEAVARLERST